MLYYFSLLFILYLPFQLALNPTEGVDLASARLLAIFIFIFWLVRSLKNKEVYLPNKLQTILLISFVFLAGFSILFAGNTAWAWKKMLFLLSFLPLYFVFSDFARDSGKRQQLVRFLIYSGALTSFVALLQFSLQFIIGLEKARDLWQKIMPLFLGQTFSQSVLEYSSWLVNVGGQTYFRAVAFFPDPHMLSLYLGLTLPWSIIFAFQKTSLNLKRSFLFWIIPALILSADLFTYSRGGYLGLIGGSLFASYWLIKKYRQKYAPIFLVLFFSLILLLLIPNSLTQRLTTSLNPTEGSNQERLQNWEEASAVIQARPFTGAGIGNYSLVIMPSAEYRDPIYAHNLYLDIAAETGIFNGMLFIVLLLSAIWSFVEGGKGAIFYLGGPARIAAPARNAVSTAGWQSVAGGALGLIIFSIHSVFETGLYSVQVLPLLVIILALSTATQENGSKNI